MSKRYSGKSFKDSSVSKKPKFSLKEKRKIKKVVQINSKIFSYSSYAIRMMLLKNILK